MCWPEVPNEKDFNYQDFLFPCNALMTLFFLSASGWCYCVWFESYSHVKNSSIQFVIGEIGAFIAEATKFMSELSR